LLDRVLVDAARQAGAEVRFGCTLTGLTRHHDVRICGAIIQDEEGASHEIASDLVVGADGIGFGVARFTGAPMVWEGQHACAVVYGYYAGLRSTAYYWYYRKGVGAGSIPMNGGLHCVFAAVPPARFRSRVRHDVAAGYEQILAEASGELAASVASWELRGSLCTFPGRRRGFPRQAWGPGWALVGDAGYFKDPLTAHGITDAFRDAELLANATADGTESGFARYAEARESLSHTLFGVTDTIASFAWDLDTIQQHRCTLNTAMKHEVEFLQTLDRIRPISAMPQEIAA